MGNFAKKLSDIKKNWAKAKERAVSNTFGDVFEDGRYKATFQKAELGESKSSSRLQAIYTFGFLDGDNIGKTVRAYRQLHDEDGEGEKRLARVLADLDAVGIEVEDADELENAMAEIAKARPTVRITLKTRGEYQDVYIDKLLGDDEDAGEETAPDAETVPEEPAAEEEGEELEVGKLVEFTLQGKEVRGEVVEILEATEEARVKVEGKIYRVKVEKLSLVETNMEPEEDEIPEEPAEEVAEEEPAPKKVTKKVGKDLKKKKR